VRRQDRPQRRLVARAFGGEDEHGLHALDDLPQHGVVPRLQRVGCRHGSVEHADVHRGQGQQRVLDAVAGEDQHRPLRRQLAVEERLRQASHRRVRLGVAPRSPLPGRAALRQEYAVGGVLRPVLQPLGDPPRVRAERLS
jgi:hypothetical protein